MLPPAPILAKITFFTVSFPRFVTALQLEQAYAYSMSLYSGWLLVLVLVLVIMGASGTDLMTVSYLDFSDGCNMPIMLSSLILSLVRASSSLSFFRAEGCSCL